MKKFIKDKLTRCSLLLSSVSTKGSHTNSKLSSDLKDASISLSSLLNDLPAEYKKEIKNISREFLNLSSYSLKRSKHQSEIFNSIKKSEDSINILKGKKINLTTTEDLFSKTRQLLTDEDDIIYILNQQKDVEKTDWEIVSMNIVNALQDLSNKEDKLNYLAECILSETTPVGNKKMNDIIYNDTKDVHNFSKNEIDVHIIKVLKDYTTFEKNIITPMMTLYKDGDNLGLVKFFLSIYPDKLPNKGNTLMTFVSIYDSKHNIENGFGLLLSTQIEMYKNVYNNI